MNAWCTTAFLLLLVLVPCLLLCLKGKIMERLVGLQMAQIVGVLIMLALSQGFEREIYLDTALVLALLSPASGLVFIRFLERWL